MLISWLATLQFGQKHLKPDSPPDIVSMQIFPRNVAHSQILADFSASRRVFQKCWHISFKFSFWGFFRVGKENGCQLSISQGCIIRTGWVPPCKSFAIYFLSVQNDYGGKIFWISVMLKRQIFCLVFVCWNFKVTYLKSFEEKKSNKTWIMIKIL